MNDLKTCRGLIGPVTSGLAQVRAAEKRNPTLDWPRLATDPPGGHEPRGSHCVMEIAGCSRARLDDAEFLERAARRAAKQANATVLGVMKHEFEPEGVTVLVLLSESHLSIHTWPEHGYAAVDLFTCGSRTRPVRACRYLAKALRARRRRITRLPRGLAEIGPTSPICANTEERCYA